MRHAALGPDGRFNSYGDIDPHVAAKQIFRKDRADRHNCARP